MAKYDGTKCISCGEIFRTGDDVVVCPECGTPYHRECYLREGKCINTELHEKDESWQPHYDEETMSANTDSEPIRCARCGEDNPPDGIFCKKCGMPLARGRGEERPFNVPPMQNTAGGQGYRQPPPGGMPMGFGQQMTFDQNSDIDGVKLGDYARYVGKNPLSLLTSFIRFGKFGGRTSLNIGAFFFPQFYFFYRKMNLCGVLLMILSVALSIPELIVMGQSDMMGVVLLNTHINVQSSDFQMLLQVTSTLVIVMRCICGMFANYWYYKTARRNILSIRSVYGESGDEESVKTMIISKGGVSFAALLMSMILYSALGTFVLFMIQNLA